MKTQRKCPICGKTYTERPAISRTDDTTPICPECGMRQALATLNIPSTEIDMIINAEKEYRETNYNTHCDDK